MRLQGHRLTFIQQEIHVQQLIGHMMPTMEMFEDVGGDPDLDVKTNIKWGDFSTKYADMTAFIKDRGHLEVTKLTSLEADTLQTLLSKVGLLLLEIIYGFHSCDEL